MHSHAEVLDRIRSTLVELFEVSPADVTCEARLYEVDLMDEVHRHTGQKARPEDFRSVRTVGDLVEAAHEMKRITDSGWRIVPHPRWARPLLHRKCECRGCMDARERLPRERCVHADTSFTALSAIR
jgi:acyl carrier protein